MSSLSREPEKVSKPTKKDFLHGMTTGYGPSKHGAGGFVLGFMMNLLLGRGGQRGRK